jgi:hypothetical protein
MYWFKMDLCKYMYTPMKKIKLPDTSSSIVDSTYILGSKVL